MVKFDSLINKIVLVTGASRGIGQAIAQAFAAQGALVLGTATTAFGAEHITQMLQIAELPGKGMVLNVTEQHSVDTLFSLIKEQYTRVDILVNNAAITRDNLFLRMKEDEWDQVIDTNLYSIYRLTKACIREMMKARWGRIINISSVVGVTGNPGQVNYAAAKAGVIGFSKALALEIGSRNITVNNVAPGFIKTDMTEALTETQQNVLFERIPMQKLGKVDDVAAAVLFLASDAADYITGQTLHVNGGMYMN
jgi:3-oxoacyl-[acyl-carrier protein] reductase